MATRYYLTTRSHGVILPGPLRGDWDVDLSGDRLEGLVCWTYLLSTSKTLGGRARFQNLRVDDNVVTDPRDLHLLRFATNPLAAQTITGTLNCCIRSDSTNFDGSVTKWHLHVYLAVGNTNVVRQTILNNYIDATDWSALFLSQDRCRALASAQSLGSVAVTAGDRLVIELGAHITATTSDSAAGIALGTLDSGGSVNPDATVGDESGSPAGYPDVANYFDFSGTITELAAVAPPANDACADATIISSLPFSETLDTTQSVDTNRAVWYQWTAPADGRVIASTIGSNYEAVVLAYTGACGSQTVVTPQRSDSDQWVQRSQGYASWLATSGVTYTIKVSSPNGQFGAAGSGGELHFGLFSQSITPVDGDLIVSAQFVTVWRDGQMVNLSPAFFGATPTGEAIDYTRRPIADYNSDDFPALDNTKLRLYVGIFGSFAYVEVVDLDTLDFGLSSGDTNVTFAPDDDDGSAKNLASIVFDPQGRLLIGYFGDNYSAIGAAPTIAASGWIRRVDGVDGLSDPGPAASPEVFEVAFENSGAEYIDVTADGSTVFYTSAGRQIKVFNLDTNTQLPDFATLPAQVGVPRPGARGLRLLPPGDGSGGLLVTYGDIVYRLDSSGNIIQSYAPSATERAQNLDKIECTPDLGSFWISDQLSTSLFKFNMTTGAQEADIETGLPIGQLSGFSVSGGYRAGISAFLTEPTEPPPLPEPGSQIDNSIPCCDTPAGGSANPGPITPSVNTFWYRSCAGGGTVPTAADIVDDVDWSVEFPPKSPDVCVTLRGRTDSPSEADEHWGLKPLSDRGRFVTARLEEIGSIERGSSDKNGYYAPARVRVVARDDDGRFRERLSDPDRRDIINREAAIEVHDYASRKAGLNWFPLLQGRVGDVQPALDRKVVVELQDIVGSQFGPLDPEKTIGLEVGDEHPSKPESSKGRIYNILLGEKSDAGKTDATGASVAIGTMPVVDCGDTFIDGVADPEGRTFDDSMPRVVDQAIVNLIPGGDIVSPTFGMVAKLVAGVIGPPSQVISLDTAGNGLGGPADAHTHRGVWMDPGGAAGDFIYWFFQNPAFHPETNPAGDPTVRYKVVSGTHTNPAFPPLGAGTWDLFVDFDSLTDGEQWGPLSAGAPENIQAQVNGTPGTTEYVFAMTSITTLGESRQSAPIVVSNGPAVLNGTDSITLTADLPTDSPDAVNFVRILGRRTNPPTNYLFLLPIDASTGSPAIEWTDDGTTLETAFNPSTGGALASENLFAWIACGLGDIDIHQVYGSDGAEGDEPKRRLIGWDEGTIVGPDSTGWPHTERYRVVGGIRQSGFYARGLPLTHHRNGDCTFAWNGCGWKDPDGVLVNQVFLELLLFLNEAVEKDDGTGYRDGDFGPIETFSDAASTPKFLTSRFEAAQEKTVEWLGSGLGYVGCIVVVEPTALGEILRRFFNDYGGHGTTNHRGQWYPYLLDPAAESPTTSGRLYRERMEIKELRDHRYAHDERENRVVYSYDYNFDINEFRATSITVEDAASIAAHGGDRIGVAQTGLKECFYGNDEETMADRWGVRCLGLYAYAPRYVTWATNLKSLPDHNGDQARFTHRKEGLGLNGETGSPGQIMGTTTNTQPFEVVQTAMIFRET